MAEPFGVPAGRVSSDVPGVIPGGPRPIPAAGDTAEDTTPSDAEAGQGESEPVEAAAEGSDGEEPKPPAEAAAPTAVPIGDDEEILELSEEERAAVPTRSDDQG